MSAGPIGRRVTRGSKGLLFLLGVHGDQERDHRGGNSTGKIGDFGTAAVPRPGIEPEQVGPPCAIAAGPTRHRP
jgi:hypothetical protein